MPTSHLSYRVSSLLPAACTPGHQSIISRVKAAILLFLSENCNHCGVSLQSTQHGMSALTALLILVSSLLLQHRTNSVTQVRILQNKHTLYEFIAMCLSLYKLYITCNMLQVILSCYVFTESKIVKEEIVIVCHICASGPGPLHLY